MKEQRPQIAAFIFISNQCRKFQIFFGNVSNQFRPVNVCIVRATFEAIFDQVFCRLFFHNILHNINYANLVYHFEAAKYGQTACKLVEIHRYKNNNVSFSAL